MTTQTGSTGNPLGTAGPIQDPSVAHRTFAEVCNSGDLEQLLAYYEPDAIIAERTGELSRGIAAIRKHGEDLLSLKPVMQILASRTVLHGDFALLSSWWHCDATAPDGSAIQLEFRGSELLRRQLDGTWLIVIDNPWGAEVQSPH